jgi:hypothetical protein
MKAVVLALAALWAGVAFAQAPATASNTHLTHMQGLTVLLDLTEAQSAQVQAILEDEHQQMRQTFESAKASGTKPDWQQMKALHQQLEQDTITKLTPVLNATQLKKFQVLMQMHRPHHHGPPPGTAPPPAGESAAAPSTSH